MILPHVRAGPETHRDHTVLHNSFRLLTHEALTHNGQLLHACAALRAGARRRAGARLQDLAGHQVLDDLAEQLDDLAVAQRGERHARARQQEVARQDRDLAACCPISRVHAISFSPSPFHSALFTIQLACASRMLSASTLP